MRLPSTSGSFALVYRAVPPTVRGWLASLYGAQSRRLRYGGSYARHLIEFREHDSWSRERLVDWQNARLRDLLRHAVDKVPYYRRLHASGKFPIEQVRTVDDLVRLPLLEKEELRLRPDDFLASDPATLHQYYTSGTTGTPVKLYRSTETIRAWYACFERRAREWAGVRLGDRFAALGGQLVVPFEQERPPFWVWNYAGQQLYMSVYHLSGKHLDGYLDELVRRRIVYIYGYASALDALATHALERGRGDVSLRAAISNAEPLFEHQRERLQRAFGCAVRDTYVPSELTVGAFECEAAVMHQSMELGALEVIGTDGGRRDSGEPGELICTGLLNFDQVFIRYRQGDRGAVDDGRSGPCACGREGPRLVSIEGRQDDVLVTADGRRIGRLDPVFKGGMAIREAQIRQIAIDTIEVLVVPSQGYSDKDTQAITTRLRERMGNVNVRVVQVDQLERSANGKLRAVIGLPGPGSAEPATVSGAAISGSGGPGPAGGRNTPGATPRS